MHDPAAAQQLVAHLVQGGEVVVEPNLVDVSPHQELVVGIGERDERQRHPRVGRGVSRLEGLCVGRHEDQVTVARHPHDVALGVAPGLQGREVGEIRTIEQAASVIVQCGHSDR